MANNANKDTPKANRKVTRHEEECELLATFVQQNLPKFFSSGFVHTRDKTTCYNKIVHDVIDQAINAKDHDDQQKIIDFCTLVNDVYEKYEESHNSPNPFSKSIKNSCRLIFGSLLKSNSTKFNVLKIFGMLFNSSILNKDFVKMCLKSFLEEMEERIEPFLKYYCTLLSFIGKKLSQIEDGRTMLDDFSNELYTFLTVKKLMKIDDLPPYVINLLKQNARGNDAAEEKPIKSEEQKSYLSKFLDVLRKQENQINEEFYAAMMEKMIEWQISCIRKGKCRDENLKALCKFELDIHREKVAELRKVYDLKLYEFNDIACISIEQGELQELKDSFQLRKRAATSIYFIIALFNTAKIDEKFLIEGMRSLLSVDAISNVALEHACVLLMNTLPKLVETESGLEAVEEILTCIKETVEAAACSMRVQCVLKDLISVANRYSISPIEVKPEPQTLVRSPLKATHSSVETLWIEKSSLKRL